MGEVEGEHDCRLISLVRQRQNTRHLSDDLGTSPVFYYSEVPLYFAGEMLPSIDPYATMPYSHSSWCMLRSHSLSHFLHLMHLTILMACNHEDESLDEVEHDTENTQGSDYNDRLLLRSVSSLASRSKGESRASFYENSKVKSVRSIRGDSDKGSWNVTRKRYKWLFD